MSPEVMMGKSKGRDDVFWGFKRYLIAEFSLTNVM
jgi:hypothetical protein